METALWQSGPTWLGSPRGYNPKFGGRGGRGSFYQVTDRAMAVKKLWKGLMESRRVSGKVYTSYHIGLELRAEDKVVGRYVNFLGAIGGDAMEALITSGLIPSVNALTFPAFGWDGAEFGGILSGNPKIRDLAFRGHVEAISRSLELKRKGLGLGRAIWWPAGDGVRPTRVPAYAVTSTQVIKESRQWAELRKFWVRVLKETGGTIHLEAKPGDPQIDVLCTPELAIAFCLEVNNELGRTGMFLNWEWAHILAMGEGIEDVTQRTIQAGLFDGFFHGNGGQKLGYRLADRLRKPVHPYEITVAMDYDLRVGVGAPRDIEDQKQAIALMNAWGVRHRQPVICEHDIHSYELDWRDYLAASMVAAEKMWQAACGRGG